MTSPVRPRGCGCLMLFSIFCLVAFTAAEVALVFWLNPEWFDRLAYWRGPILKPDLVLVEDPTAKAQLAREDDEWAAAHRESDPRVVLLDDRAVEVDYQSAQGATLQTKENGTFEFPAGSIRESCRLRVVPVASISASRPEDRIAVAGPCYKLFIGKESHYQFVHPMRVVLPYAPDLIPSAVGTKDLAIYIQEGDGWKAVPSTIDPARRTVTAEVPHCSFIVVGLGAFIIWSATPAGLVTNNSMLQGAKSYLGFFFDEQYHTAHFSIHYVAKGSAAPPLDSGPNPFPAALKPAAPDLKHPNSVVKLGEYMEFCYDHLQDVGMDMDPLRKQERPAGAAVGAPPPFHLDVYLLPQEPLGETPRGGTPVYITTHWGDDPGRLPPADQLDALMRGTVAHELIHTVQPRFFGGAALSGAWWIEMSAEYLSEVFWEKQNKPTNMIALHDMAKDAGRLLATPIDGAADLNDTYRYASFLKWLERDGKDRVLHVVDQMNQGGDPSVQAFDKALRAEYHQSLAELLAAFAQTYYYFDLRDRTLLPPAVYRDDNFRRLQIQAAVEPNAGPKTTGRFTAVVRVPAAGRNAAAVGELSLWAQATVSPLGHLTTHSFPVMLRDLPRDRKAKLVVKYEPPDDPNRDFSLAWARATIDATSVPGALSPFTPVEIQSPQTSWVISDLGTPGANNIVTILLSNQSLTQDLAGGVLERWALLRPAWASSGRKAPHSREWVVCWHEAELKAYPQVFHGYSVYRRKVGEPDSALQRVALASDGEVATDEAPDDEDYVYTVRVVDALGNESADSPLGETDPFQGLWEGEVQLVEGSLVEPLLRALGHAGEKIDKQNQAEMDKIGDPAEKARRQQEWEEAKKKTKEVYDEIAQLLRKCEQLARLGLPLQVKIRMTEGKYYLSVPEILWAQTGAGPGDEWELKRDEHYTLRFIDMPTDMPPVELRLWRVYDSGRNEIRGDYELDFQNDEGKREHCKLKWTLFRLQPGAP